jgi:hypothetical protein
MSAIRARSKSMSPGRRAAVARPVSWRLRARPRVDVLGAFGDLRKHGHAVGQHLDEPEGDGQVVLSWPVRYHISPTCKVATSGACPGNTPK